MAPRKKQVVSDLDEANAKIEALEKAAAELERLLGSVEREAGAERTEADARIGALERESHTLAERLQEALEATDPWGTVLKELDSTSPENPAQKAAAVAAAGWVRSYRSK